MSDKVLVCGSRDWSDSSKIFDVLKTLRFTNGPFTVIHGGATGADRIAGACARKLGLEVVEYPANWTSYGKKAGYLRNVEMADQNPAMVVAFQKNGSTGTQMMVDIATERSIDVLLFRDPEPVPRIH